MPTVLSIMLRQRLPPAAFTEVQDHTATEASALHFRFIHENSYAIIFSGGFKTVGVFLI